MSEEECDYYGCDNLAKETVGIPALENCITIIHVCEKCYRKYLSAIEGD